MVQEDVEVSWRPEHPTWILVENMHPKKTGVFFFFWGEFWRPGFSGRFFFWEFWKVWFFAGRRSVGLVFFLYLAIFPIIFGDFQVPPFRTQRERPICSQERVVFLLAKKSTRSQPNSTGQPGSDIHISSATLPSFSSI